MERRYEPMRRRRSEYEQRITVRLPSYMVDYLKRLAREWEREYGGLMPAEGDELTVSDAIRLIIDFFRRYGSDIKAFVENIAVERAVEKMLGRENAGVDLYEESVFIRVPPHVYRKLKHLQSQLDCPDVSALLAYLADSV